MRLIADAAELTMAVPPAEDLTVLPARFARRTALVTALAAATLVSASVVATEEER